MWVGFIERDRFGSGAQSLGKNQRLWPAVFMGLLDLNWNDYVCPRIGQIEGGFRWV